MADLIVDVILPEAITANVESPTDSNNVGVFLQGPQGPVGPVGPMGIDNVFKNIFVTGQSELIPTGLETLRLVANSGLSISTDPSLNPYKSIIINAVPLSGYFESENIVGYSANLSPQGSDQYYVQFPSPLASSPKSIVCTFQNTIDDMIYYFSLGNSTSAGFYINFSDILNTNGYYLNIQVKK